MIVSGSGFGQAEFELGRFSAQFNTNYFAESKKFRSATDKYVDIGEYTTSAQLAGRKHQAQIILGHQDLGMDGLVVSGFSRRGLSLTLSNTKGWVSGTVFVLRTDPIIGANEFIGIGDSQNRIRGVAINLRPIGRFKENLKVSGVNYEGEGSESSFGISGDPTSNRGSGWGVMFDSQWFNRKLQISGELAGTDFDFDGRGTGLPSEKGSAYAVNMAYSPFAGLQVAGMPLSISVQANHSRVDTFFKSLTNLYLSVDRETTQSYANFNWGNFSASVQGNQETNNVDDLPSLPTDRQRSLNFYADYSPKLKNPDKGIFAWLGAPQFSVNANMSDYGRRRAPKNLLGPELANFSEYHSDVDNVGRSLSFSASFTKEHLYWSISQGYSNYRDKTDLSSDTDDQSTDIYAGFQISENLNLTGGIQRSVYKDKDFDLESENININLGIATIIVPDVLSALVAINYNLIREKDFSPANTYANWDLRWTILQPRVNRVGVDLVFSGYLDHATNQGFFEVDGTTYQIFSRLVFTSQFGI